MINPVIYFLLALKASLFSTGGFANLPSLHQDFIGLKWATDADFADAVAIGQISPGPNGLWVICLGYFTYGYLGALLCLVAITIPPLFVLITAAVHARIEHLGWVDGLLRGVSLGVIGILIAVVWTILHEPGVDGPGWIIAVTAFALAASRRVPLIVILGLAGAAGFALYR